MQYSIDFPENALALLKSMTTYSGAKSLIAEIEDVLIKQGR
jgi:hypothetical protein